MVDILLSWFPHRFPDVLTLLQIEGPYDRLLLPKRIGGIVATFRRHDGGKSNFLSCCFRRNRLRWTFFIFNCRRELLLTKESRVSLLKVTHWEIPDKASCSYLQCLLKEIHIFVAFCSPLLKHL